jgi:AcrR family transcriptional regulator
MLIISTAGVEVASARVRKKQETRQRLIAAAAELAAERGFAGVALMDVAERAGLTTGAVYSNFRSREELLTEVAITQINAIQGGWESGPRDRPLWEVARGAARIADRPDTRRLVALQFELYMLALRDPELRAEMQRRNQRVLERVARLLEAPQHVPDLPRPPLEQVAEALFAMLQGLQQHRLIFPDQVPDDLFTWCAAALLRASQTELGAGHE